MSGCEIAGIVLGVLPLVLGAMKTGKKVKTSFDRAAKAERYLSRYMIQLHCDRSTLEEAILGLSKRAGIEGFTEEVINSKRALAVLTANDKRIATTLGRDKTIFIAALEEAQELCRELVTLFKDLLPERVSILQADPCFLRNVLRMYWCSSTWERPKPRLKFLNRRAEIEETLEAFAKIVRSISRLAKQCKDESRLVVATSEQRSKSKTAKAQLAALEKLQIASTHLYVAVARTVPGTCASHDKHFVRLFLEAHTGPERFIEEETQHPTFLVEIFGLSEHPGKMAYHKDRIAVRECCEVAVMPSPDPQPKRRRVRFEPESYALKSSAEIPPQAEIVDTFCKTLALAGDKMLVVHVSEAGVLQSRRKPCVRQQQLQRRKLTTLADILARISQGSSSEKAWTRQQRIYLGFVLASNLLQLSHANWVPECLAADMIQFYVNSNPAFDSPPFDSDQPFFENVYTPKVLQCQSTSLAKQWSLDLAIILLELWKGKSFKQWVSELGSGNVYKDHERRRYAAQMWFDELSFDLLEPYKDAVQACLEFSGMSIYKWEARSFREDFFARVVRPLEGFCMSVPKI